MVRSRQKFGVSDYRVMPGVADRRSRRREVTKSGGLRVIAGISILATVLLGLNALVQAINVIVHWS